MPLVDSHGLVFGHLGALDTKPLALTPRIEGVFRVFAARAGAEIQRLRAEAALHERERELASLLDGAWDAILVIDQQGVIRQANKSCAETLQIPLNALIGREFTSLLGHSSAQAWRSQMDRIQSGSISQRHFWIGDLDVVDASGGHLAAEATLSYFERNSAQFWTIILRDLNERYEAERQLAALRDESRYLRDELAELLPVGAMTGECEPMRQVFAQIRLVAATEATVLICGETGTGKELAARAIHDFSPRRAKPMIRVNCAAIPASLIESEFFGHERGAFTGATQRRDGRFALADGGTLFLDEIGELPLDLQAKLLRVLQEGEFEPVGSSRTRKVDVRIIAATNRDLRQESEQGRFRSDLFYRLNVFPIRIPALRERGEDVVLLAESFLNRYGEKMGRRFRPLSPAALNLLRGYDWPGNVRELENVLERAAILSRNGEILLDPRTLPAAPPSSSARPDADVLTAGELLALERRNLINALESCQWRVAGNDGAARLLGVPPSTVSSRMKALQVERPREKS